MKHPISNEPMQLFAGPREYGHREWGVFRAVHDDYAGMYRVHTPEIARAPRYPNAVHIRRHEDAPAHPHPLVLRGTH